MTMRFIRATIVLLCLTPADAADAPEQLITVSGEAMTTAVPDQVSISLGVATQGKSAREASDANARVMTAVLAAIKAAGVAERDVQTARLSLQPQFEQPKNGPPRLTGFHAGNEVSVKLREVGKLADLIDRAVAAGANEMSGIEFSISDRSKRLDAARADAIADARRKAEIYANAAGVKLGRAVAITENGGTSPPPRPTAAFRAATTPVAPGELALHASVTVSYELTPSP
jgi:uncharacterized protein YggE